MYICILIPNFSSICVRLCHHAAFDTNRKTKANADAKDRRIAQLEEKLRQKTEVVAELAEGFTDLKKTLGET